MSGPTAVVLAGGLGTRLGARARGLPKYLVPVAGKPFALWQLERLRACGFSDVVLCVGHGAEAIRAALGDGRSLGLALRYAEDGPELLGTGGALRGALPLLPDIFLLTYGDSYLPFDYARPLSDLSAHPEADATMAVFHNQDRYDRSNARVAGERVVAFGKNGAGYDHIDYGAMAVRRRAAATIPPGPSDLAALQTALARRGTLRALLVEERFYEIGSEAGLGDLEALLGRRRSTMPS